MPRHWDRRRPSTRRLFVRAAQIAVLLGGVASGAVWGDEPLHERIDRIIEADPLAPLAPPSSDAEFLRRASLDFIGRIPSVAEARAFLDDQSPDKRGKLIDRLLARPEYARHIATVFDVALMERRPEKNVPIAEWQRYLYESFAANKPFDQLVREILSADGVDPATRAPARFYLDREGEGNLLTRDVGRIFLGMDLQCAQCHDHPLIADYYQGDYQGLFAFFNRTTLFTDKEKKVSLAEKADGEVNYQSVFDAAQKGTASPKLPGGEPIAEPVFAKGDEYVVAPADGVRPVPKYSRRAQLAPLFAAGRNRMFDRTTANRLWAYLLGRGLIDPVDLDHGDNPPTYPAALDLLADALPAMKYDIKAFLSELARTRAYGRSIDLPSTAGQRGLELAPQVPAWEAERARLSAVAEESRAAASKARAELAGARAAAAPVSEELAKAKLAGAEAKKAADTAAQALAAAQNALPGKQEAARLVAEASAKTAEAVQKLADDKELADAAGKLKTRTDQLAAEVTALTKAVTEGPAAVKTTADQLVAAEQALAAIMPHMEPLAARVATTTAEARTAETKARADGIAVLAIAGRIEDGQALAGYTQALAAIEASRPAATKTAADLAAAQQAVGVQQAELSRANAALAATEKEIAAAATTLDEARKQQADRKATLDAVSEALAKTEVARQKLPDSAELAQAAQALKTKNDELTVALKTSETQLAEREATAQGAGQRAAAARQLVDGATAQLQALAGNAQALEQAAAAARQKAEADSAAIEAARKKVVDQASARCAVAALKQLTPEQLAWSMMQASGVVERERAAVEAEWAKNHPTPDEAAQAARPREIDSALNEKLKPNVAAFVSLFAAGPGQPQQAFQATVDQALFLANGGQVRSWLAPVEGNLTDRVVKLADPQQAANELYLTVLSRGATADETTELTAYLANRAADRAAAVQELIWALFCSAEFRFNH